MKIQVDMEMIEIIYFISNWQYSSQLNNIHITINRELLLNTSL